MTSFKFAIRMMMALGPGLSLVAGCAGTEGAGRTSDQAATVISTPPVAGQTSPSLMRVPATSRSIGPIPDDCGDTAPTYAYLSEWYLERQGKLRFQLYWIHVPPLYPEQNSTSPMTILEDYTIEQSICWAMKGDQIAAFSVGGGVIFNGKDWVNDDLALKLLKYSAESEAYCHMKEDNPGNCTPDSTNIFINGVPEANSALYEIYAVKPLAEKYAEDGQIDMVKALKYATRAVSSGHAPTYSMLVGRPIPSLPD